MPKNASNAGSNFELRIRAATSTAVLLREALPYTLQLYSALALASRFENCNGCILMGNQTLCSWVLYLSFLS